MVVAGEDDRDGGGEGEGDGVEGGEDWGGNGGEILLHGNDKEGGDTRIRVAAADVVLGVGGGMDSLGPCLDLRE